MRILCTAILFMVFLLGSCSGGLESPGTTQQEDMPPEQGGQVPAGDVTSEERETADQPGQDTAREEPQGTADMRELENSLEAVDVFPGLSFQKPLLFTTPGDGTGRMFVVEQRGQIYVVDSSGSQLFLDIRGSVDDSGNEMGLLGLAFHPDFSSNGRFYLNYTDSRGTVISQFMIDPGDPGRADPGSERVLLTYEQPYSNHNGGHLEFGPEDGYLYIAAGDGGSAGDPGGNGQDPGTLLGSILRIDVDRSGSGTGYAIPDDNPFADREGYRGEVFAFGLRNPWRFSFDPVTGRLWAGDVGQDQIEEIDIIEKGKNYGWNIMEGSQCYQPPSGCDTSGLELPVYEYTHSLGRSITGGYVYRGTEIPALEGVYIYADFVSGTIWGLVYDKGGTVENFTLAETGLNISSFGMDEDQELYLTAFDGKVYKLSLP